MSKNHLNKAAGVVPTAVKAYAQVEEYVDGANHRTVIDFTAYPLVTTDNGTIGGAGSVAIYTFPKGYIGVCGGIAKWTTVNPDGTGLTTSVALDVGVGSTAAGTDTATSLTGTADNIVTSLAFTLSAADASNQNGPATYTARLVLDGTTTAAVAYLNAAATASTSTAAGVLTLTGQVVIDWVNYGYAGD